MSDIFDLPKTEPNYVYCILQGAGYMKRGRPIRGGNFYVYKLHKEHATMLQSLLDEKPLDGVQQELSEFLHEHDLRWDQRMTRDGHEARRDQEAC